MTSLEAAMGERERFLRRAWKIREPGRFGYVTCEVENEDTLFCFYLLIDEEWNQMTFIQPEGITGVYQGAVCESIVDVARNDEVTGTTLQLIVTIDVGSRWWFVYWSRGAERILLVVVRTTVEPNVVVV
jgi:hypothetical protein